MSPAPTRGSRRAIEGRFLRGELLKRGAGAVDDTGAMPRNPAELLATIDELPPMPAVAARIMSIAEDEKSSAMDLAQVISTDNALTAKLIRLSNSAYYGFARKVSSVREAVLLLGFKQVRQVAVGASMMNAFRRESPDGFDMDLFWGHSVAVAVAAEALAKRTRTARPEDAFTAGILHDIGRLIIRQCRPEEFGRALRMARTGTISLHAAEIRACGYAHDEVGRALGELWRFPAHLTDAIAGHHNSALTPEAAGLAGILAQANRLLLHYGFFCGYETAGSMEPLPQDLAEVEAAAGGIQRVLDRAFAFIDSASGTPQHWYAHAAA